MHEPELFETYYEINKPHTSPTFWKIVGATLAIHLVAFITLSQVNLLQTKACDSPYVGKVCEALDAAYVGSVFLGTDRTSVDAPYEKTELDDADITFIDVSNMEPDFKYPEGYFEPEIVENDLAVVDPNGNPIMNPTTGTIPGFPNSANPTVNPTLPPQNFPNVNSIGKGKGSFGGNSFGKGAKLPPANPNSLTGNIPDSPIADSGKSKIKNNTPAVISTTPTQKKPTLKNESPDKLPDFGGGGKEPKVKNTPKPKVDTNQIAKEKEDDKDKINKRPINDYAIKVRENWSAIAPKLGTDFETRVSGVLKDGKLDKKTIKPTLVGDAELNKVVLDGILAMNDGNYLSLLEKLSGKTLDLIVSQKDGKVTARVEAVMESDLRANSTSAVLGVLLQGGILKKNNDIADKENSNKQNDIDELMLLQNAKASVEGKKVILKFELPSDAAKAFIDRKLKDAKPVDTANATPKQSQIVAETKNANVNIVK